MNQEKFEKFIEKLKTNVEYRACGSIFFVFYDKDIAEKITEHSKKILNKTEKYISKYISKNFEN